MNEYEYEKPSREDIEAALWHLVIMGQIEMGMDEDGEIVYWMTDKQKEDYFEEYGNA
jgi:hypothetical protein